MKGVAAADAQSPSYRPGYDAVLIHCLNVVIAAGRLEAALPANDRTQCPLIDPHHADGQICRQIPEPVQHCFHVNLVRCGNRCRVQGTSSRYLQSHSRSQIVTNWSRPWGWRQLAGDVFHRACQGLAVIGQRAGDTLPGDQNQVQTCRQLVLREPERLTQQPFQAIATDGGAMFLGNAQPDPGTRQLVHVSKNQQMLIAAAALPSVNAFEVGSATQVLSGPEAQVDYACGGAGGLLDGRSAF